MFAEIGNKICGITSSFAGCVDQATIIGVAGVAILVILAVGALAYFGSKPRA